MKLLLALDEEYMFCIVPTIDDNDTDVNVRIHMNVYYGQNTVVRETGSKKIYKLISTTDLKKGIPCDFGLFHSNRYYMYLVKCDGDCGALMKQLKLNKEYKLIEEIKYPHKNFLERMNPMSSEVPPDFESYFQQS